MCLLATKAGVVNTYWALLLPALVNPFGVYLARVFSEGYVPNEILEAARVDGAGELCTFARISLPLLAPGYMTIFLFSFTAGWNNFFGALVMLKRRAALRGQPGSVHRIFSVDTPAFRPGRKRTPAQQGKESRFAARADRRLPSTTRTDSQVDVIVCEM